VITTALLLLQHAIVPMSGPSASVGGRAAAPVTTTASPASSATSARAVRASKAPVIDGRDDDEIWRLAQPISAFRVYDPVEDGEPPMRTEVRISYDERYLYAFARMYDPHPDSIRAYLSRRDVRTPSDQVKLLIDSYHDRRTGYEFAVNPAGVKRDYSIANDSDEDDSWDGIWDVATRIDADGWTAEFRIPLSQMRFAPSESQTFGLAIARDIARSNVRVAWPVYRRSKAGIASQFGELTGFEGLGKSRRLEVAPYTVAKDVSVARPNGSFRRGDQMTAGADLKYGLTSNLTVDATINPDFGQVEADPSVLNLTSFEQFYAERRPFFLEGAGILRYDLECNDGRCSGLFYSRRIGRSPQLAGLYGDASTKQNTNILAAAKITGRLANGLSIGVLDAATERVTGPGNQTVEPQTNYFVSRLNQDFRNGLSAVGLMVTGTNRQLDAWSRDYLRRAGYSYGLDARHRFGPGNNYQISGNLAGSTVQGSAKAIFATQLDPVHNYQRPDDDLLVDSTRTSLSGYTTDLSISKVGGGIVRFNTGYKRTSEGFEVNDAGFQQRADQQSLHGWMQLQYNTPSSWYRSARVNFNGWTQWNMAGIAQERGGNINAHVQTLGQWWLHAGFNLMNLGDVVDDRGARGGPAMLQLPAQALWFGVETDQRWRVSPGVFVNARFKDASGSWNYSIDQYNTIRVSDRLELNVGASYFRQLKDAQWNGNVTVAGVNRATFARLDQTLLSATARMDFTATPTLSLQLYASPFITSGRYADWRLLTAPRAADYAQRFTPYVAGGDPGGFNFKQFRSNTVIRWEYRRGSTLFLVWAQGRTQDGVDQGTFNWSRDGGNLFRSMPDNTFLIKTSYWLNW
jgi:hypothetical protein